MNLREFSPCDSGRINAENASRLCSTVAEKVILSRSSVIAKYGSLSVDGVNEILDEISRTTATKGADGKRKMPSCVQECSCSSCRSALMRSCSTRQQHALIIKGCIGAMTPREMKWLIRIILRGEKLHRFGHSPGSRS